MAYDGDGNYHMIELKLVKSESLLDATVVKSRLESALKSAATQVESRVVPKYSDLFNKSTYFYRWSSAVVWHGRGSGRPQMATHVKLCCKGDKHDEMNRNI